jgi:hypothetical protein
MGKLILFTLIFLPTLAAADPFKCSDGQDVVFQKFFPTPFGASARTIDNLKEAVPFSQEILQFLKQNKEKKISQIHILGCSSHIEMLKPLEKDEHINLATKRAGYLKSEIDKIKNDKDITVVASAHACGPIFEKKMDANKRMQANPSTLANVASPEDLIKIGKFYEEQSKILYDDFKSVYQDEALITDFEEAKKAAKNIFELKFKPFQGMRISICGVLPEQKEKKESKKPSSKIQ